MTTHTPGPWRDINSNEVWSDAERALVANCGPRNVYLIAAAPDMRQVIEEALYNLDRDGPAAAAAVLNTKGRAAIAKAEGEKS